MQAIQQLIDERESAYPDKLEQARIQLREMQVQEPAVALPKLAEVLYWLGDYATEPAKKEEYLAKGVEVGKQAVEVAPNSAAAHLWYASNMGSHGMIRGIMSSLFYLGPIEKHAKRAAELDETLFYAGPLRLLGRFYHQAPGWPVGPGDHKKSLACLERAVELAPDFGFNRTYLADLYLSKGKKAEAKAQLEAALAIPEDPAQRQMQQKFRDDAAELMKKV